MLSEIATPVERALVEWGRDNGVKFKASKLKWPVMTPLGRGMVAVDDIEQGELLFQLPSKCQFKLRNAPQYFREMIAKSPKHIWYENDDFAQLSMFLMDCKLHGNDSFWAPYINALSPDIDTPTNGWTMKELQELQFENVIAELKKTMNYRKYVFREVTKFHASHGRYNISNYTLDLYAWAWTVIETRAWSMPGAVHDRVLNPFIDLLNHDSSTQSRVELSNHISAFYSAAVKAGEEVFNRYGEKNNRDLLYYGFALKDNVQENLEIKVDRDHSIELSWLRKRQIPLYFRSVEAPHVHRLFTRAQTKLSNILASLPTTLHEDEMMWDDGNKTRRTTVALAFRISRKKLISKHLQFCKQMMEYLSCLPTHKGSFENVRVMKRAWTIASETVAWR